MADGVSYYFQVTGNQSQYFQCQIQNPDCGGFECYPAGESMSALKFYNDDGDDSVNFVKEKLIVGQYYRVQVSEDYKILVSEYSEDGKVGKEIFNLDLENISTKFMALDENVRPDVNETNMQYNVGGGAEQVFVDDKGKIKDGTEAAADATSEAAVVTTTTAGTTTTARKTTQEAAAANADATSEAAVVTTTTAAGGSIKVGSKDVDTNTLIGITGALVVVLVLLIVLARIFLKPKQPKGGDDGFDSTKYQPITGHESPIPAILHGEIEQAEWNLFLRNATEAGYTGHKAVQYAIGLANDAINERKNSLKMATRHPRGGRDLDSLGGKYDSTLGTPDESISDILSGAASRPAAPSANPETVAGGDDDELLALLAQAASAAARQQTYGDGTSSQSFDPAAQPPAVQPDVAQSGLAQPSAVQPDVPEPVVQYTNDPVSAEESIAMAEGARSYSEARELDGTLYLQESATGGKYFGLPYEGSKIRVMINPSRFPKKDPFYEYGEERIAKFFTITPGCQGCILSQTAAIFEPVPNKPGMYRCQTPGIIEQESDAVPQPVVAQSDVAEPAVKRSAAKKPSAKKPSAKKPSAKKPAAKKTVVTESAAQPPVVWEPVAPQPVARYTNDPVSAADCIEMAKNAQSYSDKREHDGTVYLRVSSANGKLFGLPYEGDSIRVMVNPAEFPEEDPFYEYGEERMARFFKITMGCQGRILRQTAAIFEPVPNQPELYRCISRGKIEQEDLAAVNQATAAALDTLVHRSEKIQRQIHGDVSSDRLLQEDAQLTLEDCAAMIKDAVFLNSERLIDGSYLLRVQKNDGRFLGIPLGDGVYRVVLNPKHFQDEAPFFRFGATDILFFFDGAMKDGLQIYWLSPAVCRRAGDGSLHCIQKGMIQQEPG